MSGFAWSRSVARRPSLQRILDTLLGELQGQLDQAGPSLGRGTVVTAA
jgi:hypothetical protein